MASIASFALADGQTTPATRTFALSLKNGELVEWTDRSQGMQVGFRKISIRYRPGTTRNRGTKITLKIQDPRLAVTAPASGSGIQPNPVAAYSTLFEGSFFLDAATDAQARKDIYAFAKNLLANADVKAMVEGPEGPF